MTLKKKMGKAAYLKMYKICFLIYLSYLHYNPNSKGTFSLVFHRGKVDHCSTYYFFYESICSEAEPQLHESRRRTRWYSTGWCLTTALHVIYFMISTARISALELEKDSLVFYKVEVDDCSNYYLLNESNCSEAEPQLHHSQKRTRWCSTW